MGDSRPSPVALRRARVLSVEEEAGVFRLGLELLEGPLEGTRMPGFSYPTLGPPPVVGEVVIANTLGPEMGLGTGGVAFVLPGAGGEPAENAGHFVKLAYTPLQVPAPPPPAQAVDLSGVPVAVLPLHSHLAPACCAAVDLRPGCRSVFVWQEGGALPVALSDTVRELKEKRLLHAVVSTGNCFGGDLEAPNVYSGLLCAAAIPADLILVGIGPGVVGTGLPHGHGGMSAAIALNAALSLGAEPVLAPRLSAVDPRERHRGLSHHTRAVLFATLSGCRVALPEGDLEIPTQELPGRHSYAKVAYGAAGTEERFGLTFKSMGRRYRDDPAFFDAAAAAVALALGKGGKA